ncbi:uncharacterized protein TNCV_448361 [Trichonephila clavipes]|nr:uncharacterized protein TNCV_448361 [Trichonephila clavipes]
MSRLKHPSVGVEVETDQGIEEPTEIMHINQDIAKETAIVVEHKDRQNQLQLVFRNRKAHTLSAEIWRKNVQFSDEAHFWLNGYVNKQNCRIWSEANPQVYVETPLHPEKLTVWCALWPGGILLQKR